MSILLLKEVLHSEDQEKPILNLRQREFHSHINKAKGRRVKSKTLKRWGRKEDKILFKIIKDLESKGLIHLQVILDLKEGARISEVRDVIILSRKVGWVSSPQKLVGRVQRLCKTSELSVRQNKLLKKLAKENIKKRKVNYSAFLDQFPGISKEILQSHLHQIMKDDKFFSEKNLNLGGWIWPAHGKENSIIS